ncbi:cyclic nucleotide-binding domain-containing protein [Vagococcus sp. DIV0080]|uniref:Cyclic nucleotide-binding domain-containing protein n=1 Tax=Candidatus Vagococcus giribetii TaxID=2230876 RepID=A0ABS3HT19_9ENTE|nr:cyclic nucleotide-binding domain-containing protein [Vagococcus sp. DIV0080]MBO0476904.1 cyclic nucleotide-binding domain-containing protein [Vagococcus sp. DIV0080]
MEKRIFNPSTDSFPFHIPGVNQAVLTESSLFYFKNREFITKEMTELNYLFIIIKGRAKVIANQENGKRIILQFLKEADLIGDLSIIDIEDETKDVVSTGETICLGIPLTVVNEALLQDNSFLLFLSQTIGKKLLARMNHFREQQTQEVKIRLAKLLMTISSDNMYQEKHTEIAEYLGVSYRHYMHTFKYFKDLEILQKKGTAFQVNLEKLQLYLDSSE